LTPDCFLCIIDFAAESFRIKNSAGNKSGIAPNMRVCWNWQTGTFEGRVSDGVWVQVPSLAPQERAVIRKGITALLFYGILIWNSAGYIWITA